MYHRVLAWVAAVVYRYPSRDLIVVGITGTKGKSTTGNILWRLLTDAGHTVGLTGTINIRIGEQDQLVTTKMTMVGRFQMQKLLRQMVRAGCDVAIVETTSEGVKQWRHAGIQYDVGVFMNLTPEHLESHGGFDNYKQAKMKLFEHIAAGPPKVVGGKKVVRASVVNMNCEHGKDFLKIGDFRKLQVGGKQEFDITITDVSSSVNGTQFKLNGQEAQVPLLGEWNAMNAAMAIGAGQALGVPLSKLVESLQNVEQVPGRMEFVDAGQPFTVIVDYAYEPVSLELLYRFCRGLLEPDKKMITLISSTGGGRDVARRPKNGAVAAQFCDYVIVTNEDPYDDDPQEIIDQVFAGAVEESAVEGQDLWRVLDRREAIIRACELAQPGDMVILTAKGAEQKMCVAGGKKIDWDDRQVVREVLQG